MQSTLTRIPGRFFFHLDGSAGHVQGACGQSLVNEETVKLRGSCRPHWPQSRKPLHRRACRAGPRQAPRSAPAASAPIRLPGISLAPAPYPMRSTFMAGMGPKLVASVVMSAAGGSHQFSLDAGRIDRDVLEQFERGGSRDRQRAVRGLHAPAAHIHRRTGENEPRNIQGARVRHRFLRCRESNPPRPPRGSAPARAACCAAFPPPPPGGERPSGPVLGRLPTARCWQPVPRCPPASGGAVPPG